MNWKKWITHSLQKKQNLEMRSKGSDEPKQLRTDEDNRLESNRSPNAERVVSESTFKEVTVNLDSELLRKAQAKGIDLSITLEQQLRRMVSGT